MGNVKTKKSKFFAFEKEILDKEKNSFFIPNLKTEKERLDQHIESKLKEIDNTDNLDAVTYLTSSFNSEVKSIKKEISDKKAELNKTYLKDVLNELSEMSKGLETINQELVQQVGEELVKAGKENVFYVPHKYELRTEAISDPNLIKVAIEALASLGIAVNLYIDGKKAQPQTSNVASNKNEEKEEKEEKMDKEMMA